MLEKLKETTREKGFLWQHVSELPPVTHATPAVVHQTTEQQEQQQEQQQAQSQVEEQTLQQQSENELPHPTEHESQPSQSQAKQDQQQPQPQQQQTEQQQQPQQQTHPLQALPLYFLKAGEKDVVADEAATASCHQNMGKICQSNPQSLPIILRSLSVIFLLVVIFCAAIFLVHVLNFVFSITICLLHLHVF